MTGVLVVLLTSPAVAGGSGLDEAVQSWVLDRQRPWAFATLERITRLGDLRVAVPVVLVVLLLSPRGRSAGAAVFVAVALATLVALVPTLQYVVARTGPTGVAPPAVSGAWPSGHAMTAAVACLLVAGLAPWALRRPALTLAVAETVLGIVCLGLVYCNFHWLTDVVSGAALAHLCVLAAAVCARRFGFDLSLGRSTT